MPARKSQNCGTMGHQDLRISSHQQSIDIRAGDPLQRDGEIRLGANLKAYKLQT